MQSFDHFQKRVNVDFGVSQCAAQREAVNFIVKRKHDNPAIRVLHLDVTSFAMSFSEAQTPECDQHLVA